MFFACDVELRWGVPFVILTTLSGLVVPSPSAAARETPVPSSALFALFARVFYSGLITRLSRDTKVVFVRAASIG